MIVPVALLGLGAALGVRLDLHSALAVAALMAVALLAMGRPGEHACYALSGVLLSRLP